MGSQTRLFTQLITLEQHTCVLGKDDVLQMHISLHIWGRSTCKKIQELQNRAFSHHVRKTFGSLLRPKLSKMWSIIQKVKIQLLVWFESMKTGKHANAFVIWYLTSFTCQEWLQNIMREYVAFPSQCCTWKG